MNTNTYFNDTRLIPTISFQARDWFTVVSSMVASDDNIEDILFQLKTIMRVQNPPSGATPIEVVNFPLGLLFRIVFTLNYSTGKNINKNTFNRVNTVMDGLEGTYPLITTYKADVAANDTEIETEMQTRGRKILRGKLS